MTNELPTLSLDWLSLVTGGGDINWKNAAAQCGIWGAAGAAGAAITGVAAPAAIGTGLIGARPARVARSRATS